jgi:hypothetical protein
MVAVIGSLTMDNVRSAGDDIDLFVVTTPGRVWLTRILVIILVRLAAWARIDLCPNYLVSSRRLAMPPDDLFTAHELAQMIPLFGHAAYGDLLAANRWLAGYLPNAEPCDGQLRDLGTLGRFLQRAAEWPLTGGLGDRVERWQQRIKMARLYRTAMTRDPQDIMLDAEVCKGHMNGHGSTIRVEFTHRRDQVLAAETGEILEDGPSPATVAHP